MQEAASWRRVHTRPWAARARLHTPQRARRWLLLLSPLILVQELFCGGTLVKGPHFRFNPPGATPLTIGPLKRPLTQECLEWPRRHALSITHHKRHRLGTSRRGCPYPAWRMTPTPPRPRSAPRPGEQAPQHKHHMADPRTIPALGPTLSRDKPKPHRSRRKRLLALFALLATAGLLIGLAGAVKPEAFKASRSKVSAVFVWRVWGGGRAPPSAATSIHRFKMNLIIRSIGCKQQAMDGPATTAATPLAPSKEVEAPVRVPNGLESSPVRTYE